MVFTVGQQDLIDTWLPHRLMSVDIMMKALKLRAEFDASPPMEIFINGQKRVVGNLSAFTNPALEAGLIHTRALLEFMGLQVHKGQLSVITRRKGSDDIGIEAFYSATGNLPKVDPRTAVEKYKGPPADAQKAFIFVLTIANKSLAHHSALPTQQGDIGLIEIAGTGVLALMANYFYSPLGLDMPSSKITTNRI